MSLISKTYIYCYSYFEKNNNVKSVFNIFFGVNYDTRVLKRLCFIHHDLINHKNIYFVSSYFLKVGFYDIIDALSSNE